MGRFIDDLGKSVKAGMKAVGPSVKSTVKGLSPAASAISSLKQGGMEYASEVAQGTVEKKLRAMVKPMAAEKFSPRMKIPERRAEAFGPQAESRRKSRISSAVESASKTGGPLPKTSRYTPRYKKT